MPKTNIENAPQFDTLLSERLFHLTCASRTGYLTVDLERHPPSNRGIIKQMIASGLFGKKQGSSVPLTEKGRAYLKRHGGEDYVPEVPHDLTRLDADELDLHAMLHFFWFAQNGAITKGPVSEQHRPFVERGLLTFVDDRRPGGVWLRPTEAGIALVAEAGDKRIRAMIDKSGDGFLRRYYGGKGLSEILTKPFGPVPYPWEQ